MSEEEQVGSLRHDVQENVIPVFPDIIINGTHFIEYRDYKARNYQVRENHPFQNSREQTGEFEKNLRLAYGNLQAGKEYFHMTDFANGATYK